MCCIPVSSPGCHFTVCHPGWACMAGKMRYSFDLSITYRNLITSSSCYWEVSSYCIYSLRSLAEPPLCSGASNYLVMTNASSQMSSSPHCYPFCCYLYSLIANLANFSVLSLQQFAWWKLSHTSLSEPLVYDNFYVWNYMKYKKKISRALHDKYEQSLKICIHTPSLYELDYFLPAASGPPEAHMTFRLSSAITTLIEVSYWAKQQSCPVLYIL